MQAKSWANRRRVAVVLLAAGIGAHTAAAGQTLSPALTPQPDMAPAAELATHRAVYDLRLHKAAASSNVSDIRGRLVLSFTGSRCAGYSLDTRIVTQIADRDGKTSTTDMRSSTWEHAQGGQFRFNNSQYLNQRLSEQVTGLAARAVATNGIDILLNKPEKRKISFSGAPLFPTQHTIAVLEAAKSGRNVLQANIYDGSEKGVKMYETTTFIGKVRTPNAEALTGVENGGRLGSLASWPVSLSYYESKGSPRSSEGTPDYELSFILYANGVSHKLLIDYGTFTIAGNLTRIDFLEPAKCSPQKKSGAKAGKAPK